MGHEFRNNRPHSVRCVHPIVTLLEKLDALSRRYNREVIEADGFVRHYEDAARIIQSLERISPVENSPFELVENMLAENDIVAMPSASDPSLTLADQDKRQSVERAYSSIAPMFWGPRIPLDEACTTIREWVRLLV